MKTQNKQYCRCFGPVSVWLLSAIIAFFTCSQASAEIDWGGLSLTKINQMQAVNSDGSPAWSKGTAPGYMFRGVVLNDPATMLDTTAAEGYVAGGGPIGGQWQVYVQAVLDGDFGGMALWVGQNYGNLEWIDDAGKSYSDAEWNAELDRLNYPTYLNGSEPVDSPLRPGDLIEVHARAGMPYKGKFNCNEQHIKTPEYDFDIYLIARNQPLQMQDVTLENIKYSDDTFIFDETRLSGGEFYQGQLVRLRGVTITNPEQWGQIDPATEEYYLVNVTDGLRSFDIVLGQNDSFAGTVAPSGTLDIVGIFDQESTDSLKSTDGYRMWALSPDDFALVPEPGVLLLLACGAVALVLGRKRTDSKTGR